METVFYILVGVAIGAIIGFLIAKANRGTTGQAEKDAAQQKYSDLEKESVAYKATATAQLQTANDNLSLKDKEINPFRRTFSLLQMICPA